MASNTAKHVVRMFQQIYAQIISDHNSKRMINLKLPDTEHSYRDNIISWTAGNSSLGVVPNTCNKTVQIC